MELKIFLLMCLVDSSLSVRKLQPSGQSLRNLRLRRGYDRRSRQSGTGVEGINFSRAVFDEETGKRCVIKEEKVESLEKKPVLECLHKETEQCHYTYVTKFNPSQEEVCDENFEKQCSINFKKQATNETVRKCYKPVVKVCDGSGERVCRTIYETSCTTKYVEKQPGKHVGDTSCEKLPVEICGAGCSFQQGPEECHEKVVAGVVEVPEEICDLNPQKVCRFQTKLVPKLTPKRECSLVPKEVCNLKYETPRRIAKPLLTKWCLDESPDFQGESFGQPGFDEGYDYDDDLEPDFTFPRDRVPPLSVALNLDRNPKIFQNPPIFNQILKKNQQNLKNTQFTVPQRIPVGEISEPGEFFFEDFSEDRVPPLDLRLGSPSLRGRQQDSLGVSPAGRQQDFGSLQDQAGRLQLNAQDGQDAGTRRLQTDAFKDPSHRFSNSVEEFIKGVSFFKDPIPPKHLQFRPTRPQPNNLLRSKQQLVQDLPNAAIRQLGQGLADSVQEAAPEAERQLLGNLPKPDALQVPRTGQQLFQDLPESDQKLIKNLRILKFPQAGSLDVKKATIKQDVREEVDIENQGPIQIIKTHENPAPIQAHPPTSFGNLLLSISNKEMVKVKKGPRVTNRLAGQRASAITEEDLDDPRAALSSLGNIDQSNRPISFVVNPRSSASDRFTANLASFADFVSANRYKV